MDFFSEMENDAIQQIEEADQAITALMESYQTNNEIFIDQLRMYADSNNENIDNTRMQDANESKINSVFLKVQQMGFHSLNTDDSTLISELANQCPFIGGTAVYKARTLYAYYAPASLFDDIKICNNAGQFKNGNSTGIFDDENGFLKTLLPDINKVALNENDILIYPNPTQSVLKIRYKSATDSKLVIIDILGISVKEIYLAKNVQNVETAIDDLSPGVYMYRQVVGDRTIHTGKLIKY